MVKASIQVQHSSSAVELERWFFEENQMRVKTITASVEGRRLVCSTRLEHVLDGVCETIEATVLLEDRNYTMKELEAAVLDRISKLAVPISL
jgi:hypothetical protein